MGALYEKLADDQQLLTEGLTEVNRRLDSVDGQTEAITRIEEKLDSVIEAVGTIQTDLTNTKERVDKLEHSAAR